MATEVERLAQLEGAYGHLATKADLANVETRLTTWQRRATSTSSHQSARHGYGNLDRVAGLPTMTTELGTILGLSIPVVLSVVGVAWRMGRVEGRMAGVEQSVERLHVDIDRLREGHEPSTG